jgi:hypothetical protein
MLMLRERINCKDTQHTMTLTHKGVSQPHTKTLLLDVTEFHENENGV